jgi:holliday junction DNA helicase RuvA
VKGIGPKKALRALVLPVGQIAQAIESRDTKYLCELPQIGKRMAELIVAELAGKVQRFATTYQGTSPGAIGRRSAAEEDAIAALVALGERRGDADHLLDRAKHANSKLNSTTEFINEMLRLRTARG